MRTVSGKISPSSARLESSASSQKPAGRRKSSALSSPLKITSSDGSMGAVDWNDAKAQAFACRIDPAPSAATPVDPSLLVIFNGEDRGLDFRLPAGFWQLALDSSLELHEDVLPGTVLTQSLHLPARSLVVLRQKNV